MNDIMKWKGIILILIGYKSSFCIEWIINIDIMQYLED